MTGMQWSGSLDFGDAARRLERAADEAVNLIGEHVLGESRRRVPIEEGTLERSGRVDTTRDGDTSVAAVSYSTPYAVRQHEELTWRHDEGRSAKYLEGPLSEAETVAREIAAQKLRGAL